MDRRILNRAQKLNYAILRAEKEFSWIETLHISLELQRFPLHRAFRILLQSFSHSVRRNVAVITHLINYTIDKSTGLVDEGFRGPERNEVLTRKGKASSIVIPTICRTSFRGYSIHIEKKVQRSAGRLHAGWQRIVRVSASRVLSFCRGIKQKALHSKMKGSMGVERVVFLC